MSFILCHKAFIQSVIVLYVVMLSVTNNLYAEYYYAECDKQALILTVNILNIVYAQCHKQTFILSVIMLSFTNKAFMRIVITLNVIMLSVDILTVMAPMTLYLTMGRKKLARDLENTHQAFRSF